MPGNMRWLCVVMVLAGLQASTFASDETADRQELWKKIERYFEPPAEFSKPADDLKSPLIFEDGSPVKTAEDWHKRRQEILSLWHQWMGAWPPIMTDQQLEILGQERREDFTQYTVRFNYSPKHPTQGYLSVPDGEGPKPAVVVVFYEPETGIGLKGENRDFAYQLTKRGFITLSIGQTEATENKTYGLYYPTLENAKIQPLSGLAYGAANAYHVLANRPDVDPNRIGIVGHSFGGKWAMFASCLYDKWACAAWSDPGIIMQDDRPSINYWEPWYLGYEAGKWRKRGMVTAENPAHGLYPQLRKQGRNLHELHALMAPRPFLVSGGSEDPPERWRALQHTIAVYDLLGVKNHVAMTNRPDHSPNPKSNQVIYDFFTYFLQPSRSAN